MASMAQGQGNGFIEHLMARTTLLRQVLQEQTFAHQLECQKYATQVAQLELEIEALKLEGSVFRMDGKFYVALLVNGDDLIFDPILLSLGETGGIAAAERLSLAINEHLSATLPDSDFDLKVIVRVYARIGKLAQNPNVAAVIESVAVLENFIRGFNSHKLYFDFVDIGIGQVDANAKIEALFDHHMGNPHCQQVILGVKSPYEYLNKLHRIAGHGQLPSICIVENISHKDELAQLNSTVQLINLDAIFDNNAVVRYEEPSQTLDIKPDINNHSVTPTSPSNDNSLSFHSAQTHHSQSPEPTALTSSFKPKQMTWARVAGTAPPPPTPRKAIPPLPPAVKSSNRPAAAAQPPSPNSTTGIPRNIQGQRIDPFYPTPEAEWRRVQQLYLCNSWFLRQECKYGDECNHKHKLSSHISDHDLQVLAQVARYAPCRYGTACEDVKCIFGHRCPVQENERLVGKEATARVCKFGRGCKFSDEMHVVDLRVAEGSMKV